MSVRNLKRVVGPSRPQKITLRFVDEDGTHWLSIRLDRSLVENAKRLAAAAGRTAEEYIADFLRRAVEKRPEGPAVAAPAIPAPAISAKARLNVRKDSLPNHKTVNGKRRVFGLYPTRQGEKFGFLEVEEAAYQEHRQRAVRSGLSVGEEIAAQLASERKGEA